MEINWKIELFLDDSYFHSHNDKILKLSPPTKKKKNFKVSGLIEVKGGEDGGGGDSMRKA